MIIRTFPAGAAAGDITIVAPKALEAILSCTTAANTTLTTTSAAFTQSFVGMAVSGIGIPAGTTVASVQSATSLTLSQAASDSTTNLRFFGGAAINCVKATNTTVTSAALFGSVFVGMGVSGPGIPLGTTVTAVASASSLTISAAATDSNTNTLCFHYGRGMWEIKAVKMRFVTDANAANRVAKFVIDDGTNIIWTSANDVAQTATVTCDWEAFPTASMEAAPTGASTARAYPMPPGVILQPGWRLLTSTTNKAAADAWSAIVLLVDEKVVG